MELRVEVEGVYMRENRTYFIMMGCWEGENEIDWQRSELHHPDSTLHFTHNIFRWQGLQIDHRITLQYGVYSLE